ncbi:MAG TPA: BlaI/MecI/CopY family transcriptional regulator [Micromonosporaceae bacterium]
MVIRGLGDLEAVIMDRLWSWDRPTSVREICDDLLRERQIAYTTVMTVMENLHRKGMLTRERDGRAWRYRPARSRAEHTAELLEEVLDGANDRTAALMTFVRRMSRSELAALRRALSQHTSRGEQR